MLLQSYHVMLTNNLHRLRNLGFLIKNLFQVKLSVYFMVSPYLNFDCLK